MSNKTKNKGLNKQGNYIYMLIGLLILIIIGPTLSHEIESGAQIITQFMFVSVMLVGVWSLYLERVWFRIGVGLAIIALILSTVNYFASSKIIFVISLTVSLLFLLLSIYLAIRHILFSGKITPNKIIGSLCIYLLIGIIWGLIYIFIAILFTEPINGITQASEYTQMWDYIYYSFVTLTTLGYGDITPSMPIIRSLAYLEAICGQFYLAILVASLVGAYLADHQKPN